MRWPGRGHHRRGPGSGWPPWPSWPPSGCACSPTTGRGAVGRPHAPGLEYATGLGVVLAQHCEDAVWPAGGMHARGRVVEPPRAARAARRGRGGDGGPGHRPGPGHRWAGPLPAPVDRRRGRPGAPGQGRGRARDRRGGAAPLHADRRLHAGLRHGLQGQPAAAHPRPTSTPCKPALADGTVDAIATDHAPHAPEPKDLPFDQAAPGHARAADGRWPWPSTELDLPDRADAGPAQLAAGRHRRARPGPRRRPRAARWPPGAPANLCVIDPTATWTVDPTALASPQPQHPLRRPHPDRPGAPHRAGRGAGRHRRGGPAMSPRRWTVARASRPCWCWPTARSSRARPSAPAPAGRRSDRRGRVQHGAVGLSGGHHRPVLRRPGHRLHLPPHRQLRGQLRPTTRRRPALPGRRGARPGRRRPPTGGPTGASRTSSRHGVAGITGVDTRRLTRHLRDHGVRALCLRARPPRATCWPRPGRQPPTDGRDLVVDGDPHGAVPHAGRRPLPGRGLRLRHQGGHAAPAGRPRHRDRGAGRHPGRGRAGAGPRRHLPVQRPGRPGRAAGRHRRDPPTWSTTARSRSSASASATSSWPPPSGPPPTSCPSATTAATSRSGALSTGRVEITSQNHNYAVAADSLGGHRGHPRQPQRRGHRGPRAARDVPAFSVQYHPEAGPGPHDARYLFDEFRMLMDATAARRERRRVA